MAAARENDLLTQRIIGFAIEVHRQLGPGLLESAYEECLCFELEQAGIPSGAKLLYLSSISRFAWTVVIVSISSSKIESFWNSRRWSACCQSTRRKC